MQRFLSRGRTAGIVALMLLLALAGVLAGCGGSNGGSGSGSGPVTITYLTHWSGPQVNQLNQAFATYHIIKPIPT